MGSGAMPATRLPACQGSCQARVKLVESMGGCGIFTYMCSRDSFGLLDAHGLTWQRSATGMVNSGVCLLEDNGRPPMMWVSLRPRPTVARMQSTLDYCRDMCNADKECTAINLLTAREECALVSPNNPDWAVPTVKGEPKRDHWKKLSVPKPTDKDVDPEIANVELAKWDLDAPANFEVGDKYGPISTIWPDAGVECYIKMTTRMITRLLGYASGLALVVSVVGGLLCFSTIHGLLLFLGRRRRSKFEPTVEGLAYAMFCPCCPGSDDVIFMDRGGGGSDD